MEKLVALSGVVKSYGTTSVLTGIDLDIAKGELIVLLGPSGRAVSYTHLTLPTKA